MKKLTKLPKSLHKIAVFKESFFKKITHRDLHFSCFHLIFILIVVMIIIVLWSLQKTFNIFSPENRFFLKTIIYSLLLFPVALGVLFFSYLKQNRKEPARIVSYIICYEEGIMFLDKTVFISFFFKKKNWIFIEWKEIKEIFVSERERIQISFSGNVKFSSVYDLNWLKAKYIYPKEIYQEESLIDGIDHDALNLLWICMRRAHNTKWTGNIKPSDIFGKHWKEEGVVKESGK